MQLINIILLLYYLITVSTVIAYWICPIGYLYTSDGSCYKVYEGAVLRNEAYMLCKKDGAHLPFVQTTMINNFIASKISPEQRVWLGVTCASNNVWNCKYDDGKTLAFHSFESENITVTTSSNVYIKNGQWILSDNLGERASFICQWIPNDIGCPENFRGFGDKCYFALAERVDVTRASFYCEMLNSTLVTIKSEAENSFVTALMNKIGQSDFAYIGAQVYPGSSFGFSWKDGQTPVYSNFGHYDTDLGNCVIISTLSTSKNIVGQGKWITANCNSAYSSVCMTKRKPNQLPATNADVCLESIILTDNQGQISSPLYGDFSPPTECHYILSTDPHKYIRIQLHPFISLEDTSGAEDYTAQIIIRDDYLKPKQFHMTTINDSLYVMESNKNTMHIIYIASSNQQSFFALNYTTQDHSYGHSITFMSMTLFILLILTII